MKSWFKQRANNISVPKIVIAGAGVESSQGGELSTISTPETRHRKVSIQSDGPHHQHQPHSRKISAVSGHGEHHLTMEALGMAMGRRKSFAHLETLSIGSHPTDKTDKHHEENFKNINGDGLSGKYILSLEHLRPPSSKCNHESEIERRLTKNRGSQQETSLESYYGQILQSNRQSSLADKEENNSNSWWFLLCKRCRGRADQPAWEPPHWQKFCPYPFCPSYRGFSRVLSLVLIGLLLWGLLYSVLGETAAPGGQLFGLAALCLAAHFGGWLVTITTLPALVGMLAVGILFQNVGWVNIEGDYTPVVGILRKFALVIILTRAGLDLDPPALKRLWVTVIKLGLGPWIVEFAVIAVATHYLLDMPWVWAFLLGSIVAAVSPAVVVPCLFRLRGKGYGVAKGIPTLIIAVSGIDDATSVAIFGIIHSVMFSQDSLTFQILQGPLSIAMGIGFGILWGLLSRFVPEKTDPYAVPLRILLLFGGGLVAVFGSEVINFGGAGPLGCVTAAFVSCYSWTQQGWEIDDNPVTTAFEIFWMIFEPILFGLTGAQIKIAELNGTTVSIGIGCLIGALMIRIISTVCLAIGSRLNLKEKIFVALSWMAKATVQAALGPVALDSIMEAGENSPDYANSKTYAEQLMTICILSIILTAPFGAIVIILSGKHLLTKTTQIPVPVEGWRRSHRPSLRDISIIDEEEERGNGSSNSSNEDNNKEDFKEDAKEKDQDNPSTGVESPQGVGRRRTLGTIESESEQAPPPFVPKSGYVSS